MDVEGQDEDAEENSHSDDGPQRPGEPLPWQKEDEEGPYQIKLLLDGQGPCCTQGKMIGFAVHKDDVLNVEDKRRPNASGRRSHRRRKRGHHYKGYKEDKIIQRPNTERPAQVEVSKIMPRPLRIQKYARDEKSRQYKE